MTQPTFLVIGAQRSATTWLAGALAAHPDVYTPETKELHFFDMRERHRRGFDWYLSHFEAAGTCRAVGECTPNYLWVTDELPPELARQRFDPELFGPGAFPDVNRDIPALVRSVLPDVRLVVILREPVERTVSAFYHHVRRRRLPPWSRILDVGHRYGIIGMSFYEAHLARWFECFDLQRFLILGFEDDVILRPEDTLATVYRHLDVDDGFLPSGWREKRNERTSGAFLYANYVAPRVATRAFRALPALHRLDWPRVVVTPEERERLAGLFAPGVARLEKRIGRRFPSWGEPPDSAVLGGRARDASR
ncbi:MAG: sulfotransferase family protein [Acidimicrobiales bacterium]